LIKGERFHLPLRWEFAPLQKTPDKSIQWVWRAYTHSGTLTMQSEQVFDTLTDCIEDAKGRGYDPAYG
jgi:hypothetical protein